jgi:PKD repeat protein
MLIKGMNTSTFVYSFALLLSACLFGFSKASAQLQANFNIDKPGGCSPLSVQFTNTTTGTSASTTYVWSFGNGNSSALANPGATYYTEKSYTITLTASDGSVTSSKSIDITVYKKPVVDFSVSSNKGCVPLTTSFTANATPGDGTIASYYWDFGDGATDQVTTAVTGHTYTYCTKATGYIKRYQ